MLNLKQKPNLMSDDIYESMQKSWFNLSEKGKTMINNLIDDFNNYQYLALEKAYNNDDNLLNKMNSIINKEKRKIIDELENQEKAEADIILANF